VPVEPTPEMIDAAAEAYMPFGDMALALQMGIVAAPAVQGEPVGYLHKRPERIPCFFESYDEAMLSGCEVVPVYNQPQPAPDVAGLVQRPDVARLVEALNKVMHCRYFVLLSSAVQHEVSATLAAHRKGGGDENHKQ